MYYYIDWFLSVESSFRCNSKSTCSKCIKVLMCSWIQFANTFCINIHQGYWSLASFFIPAPPTHGDSWARDWIQATAVTTVDPLPTALGQGLNWHLSSDPSCCRDNTGSLTCYTTAGTSFLCDVLLNIFWGSVIRCVCFQPLPLSCIKSFNIKCPFLSLYIQRSYVYLSNYYILLSF